MHQPDYILARKHLSHHRAEILSSEVCGCCSCSGIFKPADIVEWVDEWDAPARPSTAVCPRCRQDSVIGSASGYPITKVFLERMRTHC